MSITVKNLVHIYSKNGPFERAAVNDVSFHIDDGEFIGLIGHTGSGKSTMIQHLNGLLKPDSGSVVIDGIDITQKGVNMREIRGKVGIVFQYPEYQLFEETVYRDIAFGPGNLGKSAEEIDCIIHDVMRLVGLGEHLLEKSPFELSGGQKRRVAIAGVLAMEPEILILDEPTAGLDPLARNNILSLISNLHMERKITVIFVTHSMEDIARVAGKIMVMADGKIAMFDTPERVFAQADRLHEIGLDVPQISTVVSRLRTMGVDLGEGIYTIEAAKNAILRYKEKQR